MPPAVRTRRATTVALATDAPLPAPGRRVLLSPFDVYWAPLPPVRRVFLSAPASPPVPIADVARALRSSLAALLPSFHPFAGELVYDPESSAVAIVCGEGAGVAFVEAETTELDFARLVEEGAEHDVDALQQLVPDIRREQLPAPVMVAQVTEFLGGCGGIAVGVAVHHTAADGRGLWRFLEMWAAAAAASYRGVQVAVGGEPVLPLHDRSLARFDGDMDVARLFLRQVVPDLPRVTRGGPSSGVETQLSRRTFTLRASAVRRLKQQLGSQGTEPSTFAAVVAHGWASIARASGFDDGAPVFAAILVDIRTYMSPPVPESYIGNCLAPCTLSLSGAELAAPEGRSRACVLIREAVAEVRRDPLREASRWVTKFADMPRGRAVIMAGSPWFPAYAMDFGFGRPARAELASMNHDGEMVLVAGPEVGSVQVSVALAADKMPAFQDSFFIHTT